LWLIHVVFGEYWNTWNAFNLSRLEPEFWGTSHEASLLERISTSTNRDDKLGGFAKISALIRQEWSLNEHEEGTESSKNEGVNKQTKGRFPSQVEDFGPIRVLGFIIKHGEMYQAYPRINSAVILPSYHIRKKL
jgi:hypothetical protein